MDYPPTPHFPSGSAAAAATSSNGGILPTSSASGAHGGATTTTTTTDMLRVGRDIIGSDARKLQSRREKKGECVSCGERLFKVNFMGKRTPLTTPHRVLSGRCLHCHPLDAVENAAAAVVHAQQQQQQQQQQYPRHPQASPGGLGAHAPGGRPGAAGIVAAGAVAPAASDEVHGYMEVPRVLHMRRRASDEDNMTVVSAITLDHKIRTSSERKRANRKRNPSGAEGGGGPNPKSGEGGGGGEEEEDGNDEDDNDDDSDDVDDDDDDESSSNDDPQQMPGRKRLDAVAAAVGGAAAGGGYGIALESAPPPPPAFVAVSSTSYQPTRSSSIHWMPPAPLHGAVPVPPVSSPPGKAGTSPPAAAGVAPIVKHSRHADVEESESTMQEGLGVGSGGAGIRTRSSFDTEEEKAEIQPLHWSSRGSFFLDSQGNLETFTPTSDRESVGVAAVAPAIPLPTVGEGVPSVPLQRGLTEIHVDPSSLPEESEDDNVDFGNVKLPVGVVASTVPGTSSHSNSSTPKSRSPSTSSPSNFFELQMPPSFRKSGSRVPTPQRVASRSPPRHSRASAAESTVEAPANATAPAASAPASHRTEPDAPKPPARVNPQGWVARSGGPVVGGVSEASAVKPDAAVEDAVRACLRRLDDGRQGGGTGSTPPATSATDRISALTELTSLVWNQGHPARAQVVRQDGLRILAKTLWSEDRKRQGSTVLEAALSLLLAIVASETGSADHDVVCGSEGWDGCVDALLNAMQTWSGNVNVQVLGCRLLACLACGSLNNPKCNDGSEAGAVAAVIHALASHPSSLNVLEWCIRALYNQCALSSQSERNARAVLTSVLEDGRSAVATIDEVMKRLVFAGESLLVERVCQLHWCLSASEAASEYITADTIVLLISSIRYFYDAKVPESFALCEAALGAIANLLLLPRGREYSVEAAKLALGVLGEVNCGNRVTTEACAVLVSSLREASVADSVMETNAISLIMEAPASCEGDTEMLQEVMRALVALVDASPAARSAIVRETDILQLTAVCKTAGCTGDCQASMCRLISSLLVNNEALSQGFRHLALETTCSFMSSNTDDCDLQAAGCASIWSIYQANQDHGQFPSREVTDCLKSAMERHPTSESIQHDACAVLWPALVRPDSTLVANDFICTIVEALKSHIGSPRVLHVACCTLWSIIHGSEQLKESLAEAEGAIDAITCVLVLHADNAGLVEVATGLLACLSSHGRSARDLATPERIETIVDLMRNHRQQARILESSVLFLLNAITVAPDRSGYAVRSLAVVVAALKADFDGSETGYHRYACSFLWIMSLSSEKCKAMIMELDGISVLMDTLEKYNAVHGIQDAALGAFNELALVSS